MHQTDASMINPDVATIPMSKREAIWKVIRWCFKNTSFRKWTTPFDGLTGQIRSCQPDPDRRRSTRRSSSGYCIYKFIVIN